MVHLLAISKWQGQESSVDQSRGKGVGMRCRRPKTTILAKFTSALPITARAIVTFWFQQLIFASGVPPLVTFPPQLDFPGPGLFPQRGWPSHSRATLLEKVVRKRHFPWRTICFVTNIVVFIENEHLSFPHNSQESRQRMRNVVILRHISRNGTTFVVMERFLSYENDSRRSETTTIVKKISDKFVVNLWQNF